LPLSHANNEALAAALDSSSVFKNSNYNFDDLSDDETDNFKKEIHSHLKQSFLVKD
jgi:hypothetical protein